MSESLLDKEPTIKPWDLDDNEESGDDSQSESEFFLFCVHYFSEMLAMVSLKR